MYDTDNAKVQRHYLQLHRSSYVLRHVRGPLLMLLAHNWKVLR